MRKAVTSTPPNTYSDYAEVARSRSRRLVIDASVVGAAGGEDATDPRAEACREFLKAIQRSLHRVVLTPAITQEWNRHQSRFSRRWRLSMLASRRAVSLDLRAKASLREKVASAGTSERGRAAVVKDMHLIEAALATDRTVASLDQEVRRLFAEASATIREIRDIVWVNPCIAEEHGIAWLEAGANPDRDRRLGFRTREGT